MYSGKNLIQATRPNIMTCSPSLDNLSVFSQNFSDPSNPTGFSLGTTWATPCDGIEECIYRHDENGCETPSWLLPVILFGIGFFLWCTLLFYSMKSVNNVIKDIAPIDEIDEIETSRFERPLYIAILTEIEDIDELKKVFQREVKIQGDEQEAICFFKVHTVKLQVLTSLV